jgi:hypothetical protein
MAAQVRMSAGDAAQTRVLTDEDSALQAALEQLAVTYSIRRILLWALVIVPAALAIAAAVTAVSLYESGAFDTSSDVAHCPRPTDGLTC